MIQVNVHDPQWRPLTKCLLRVLAVWKRGDARAREKKRSSKLPLGGKKLASKSDLNRPKKNHSRCFSTFCVFTHGVIPGSSLTQALGISSPGIDEAHLMGPC